MGFIVLEMKSEGNAVEATFAFAIQASKAS